MASGMICNHFTPHFDLRLNVNKMLHSIASSCVFSPEVSLVQLYYYSRRKGGKQNVCVCGFASKEDHALKLHRYHVRFQRFIRTSDHGNEPKFLLDHSILCLIEIAFFCSRHELTLMASLFLFHQPALHSG